MARLGTDSELSYTSATWSGLTRKCDYLVRPNSQGVTMKGNTVARTLKTRLTEEGLKRVIKRSSIYNDRFIAEFSADELERLIQIEPINMSRGGRVIAKKSRRRQNYL